MEMPETPDTTVASRQFWEWEFWETHGPAMARAGVAIGCFCLAGFFSIPHRVLWWWRFVDYDGEVPFELIVLMERAEFLLLGVVPFGLAVIALALRGRLCWIPWVTTALYSAGAGLLAEGIPLVTWYAIGRLLALKWVGMLPIVAAAYYVLLAGLARHRERARHAGSRAAA